MNSLSNKQQYLNLINYFKLLNSSDTEIKNKSKGVNDITICVIDHGVIESIYSNGVEIPAHEAFNGLHPIFYRIRNNETHNHWDNKYGCEHGTNVVGIIFANDNEKGSIGIAPNCSLVCIDNDCPEDEMKTMSLKLSSVFSKLAEPKIQNDINWSKPVDVINCSWGMADLHTNLIQSIDTITNFGRKGLGIVACFASGNENKMISENENSYFAAGHKKVITVGAVIEGKRWIKDNSQYYDSIEQKYKYTTGSNYGSNLDICAPIDGILTPSAEIGNIASLQRKSLISNQAASILELSTSVAEIHIGCCVYIPDVDYIGIAVYVDIEHNKIGLVDVKNKLTNDISVNGKELYYSKFDDKKYAGAIFHAYENTGTDDCKYFLESIANIDNFYNGRKVILVGIESGYESYVAIIKEIGFEQDNFYIVLQQKVSLNSGIIFPTYGDYLWGKEVEGTSFATPIVTGVVSLMLSLNEDLNWLEVRKILRDTATKDNLILKDSKDGISHFKDGFCQAYGYGMVDAFEAVKAAKNYIKYDLWIKRSEGEGDVGTDLGETVDINVPDSDLNCSPHTINTKISNIGAANSIEGAEIRYLIRFSDLSNPAFEFPDAWMDNQIDSFFIGNSEIGVIQSGKTLEIKQEGVTQTIGEKKIGIEKVLRKCPADKHPYLLVHITPFDYGVTGNSVRTNNNLAYKRDVFLNAEFLQGDGTTRLPNSLPKSETPVPFKINVKMYNKAGAIDLNGMELKVKGFVKKNQEDKEEQENKNTVFYAKYEGATFRTEIEQNNIVTDISTEVVDRNAQDKVTEVVISGNIHISELYKKLQITVTVSNCLNECSHEIRRKSAVFSKIASALVEDMEFREKIYFFTDCDNLSNTKKYGAISSGDTDFQTGFDRYRITNVFAVGGTQETNTENGTETTNETNSETSTPHKAYAVCKGKILVQEDKDDASLVNIVLKPEMHSSNNPAVKYFVYRGILKSSLYESDNSLKTNGNSVVSWIEKNIKEPDGRILGLELTNDARYGNEAPIDNAFYNSDGEFELLTVPAGWCIGTFADNYIGFEIWLDTIGFNPTFSMIRNHETIIAVEQLPMNPTDGDISAHKAQKEQILNYMDPAAYFGNLYDDRIFVRNTNSEASRDGIEYSFEKVKKENLYTQIIDNFLNKNVVYIDIRNEFNTSYNYFGNYGNVLLKVLNNKNQPTPDDCYNCYGNSDWPIIATIFTPSFDDGVVKIAFKKGDNETPLAYAAIGERGRTIAEKIAQGKTNFVDLTAENGDYTDNSVAMVVPFRKNTAPNMENTYISVASYMRIDYLRRMKPKTPNNQETQEPQEQQEPQTPENTENLPVWKQRESSADLLFRPMDMKLPIENVTEGFVVKVYEDEVYIDVPEHQIDYMARMGIARDPDNTYLFAVKSDLHTKNAFQMSNPRFSICSGVNKITKEQFMKYVFGGNYTKKEIKEENTFSIQYATNNIFSFEKTNPISVDLECILIVISNEKYHQLQSILQNIPKHELVYLKVKKTLQSYYSKYKLYLQKISASDSMDESLIPLDITLIK